MKKIFFVFSYFILFCFALYFLAFKAFEKDELNEEERIYISTALTTALGFKERYDLRMSGFGLRGEWNTGNHLIDKINLCFTYRTFIEKDEARKLLVAFVESYVKKINENPTFSKYLYKIPLTANELDIILIDKHSPHPVFPNIYSIQLLNGFITYETIEDDEDHFSDYEKESFEDAQRIVQESARVEMTTKNNNEET